MKKILVAILVLLLVMVASTACQPMGPLNDGSTTVTEVDVTETESEFHLEIPEELPNTEWNPQVPTNQPESESETEFESESESINEGEMTRLDYFSADMNDYVTIDPAAYADMTVELDADLLVDDEDVAQYIIELRFDERGEAEAETMVDEPLDWGDDAYIYYKGYVDGVAFVGGSNMEDQTPTCLGLGSSDFIPGFEAGLVGVIPSETSRENPPHVTCRFPSWYSSSALAGKEAVFEVYVVYAVEHSFPEYNKDFVENTLKYKFKEAFYASDAACLAEFEEYVRDYVETSIKVVD